MTDIQRELNLAAVGERISLFQMLVSSTVSRIIVRKTVCFCLFVEFKETSAKKHLLERLFKGGSGFGHDWYKPKSLQRSQSNC